MEKQDNMVIVSMLEFKGRIYVASQKHIYVLKDDKLCRLYFEDGNTEGRDVVQKSNI